MVHNGSTDGSKEYLGNIKDRRFKIITRENASLADILNGKLAKGSALLIAQLVSNPGIVIERIRSRI